MVIHGRETKLPSDLKRFLSSGTNKTRLVKFMCDDWIKLIPSKLESHQKVILGIQDGTCLEISRRGVNEVSDLECDHEEADTRMLLHCKQSKVNGCDRLVVCSPDTDVAVLVLPPFSQYRDKGDVFFNWNRNEETLYFNPSNSLTVREKHL